MSAYVSDQLFITLKCIQGEVDIYKGGENLNVFLAINRPCSHQQCLLAVIYKGLRIPVKMLLLQLHQLFKVTVECSVTAANFTLTARL